MTAAAAPAPKLKRLLNDFSLEVFENELVGEWSDDDYTVGLVRLLEPIDLNEHRLEIVRAHVRRDVSERAKRQVFIANEAGVWQPSMFTEELARQGVIRLGNGARVKMVEASGPHWMSHLFQQQKALSSTSQAIDKTVRWLESAAGAMLTNDPKLRTYEAMQQLGFWRA